MFHDHNFPQSEPEFRERLTPVELFAQFVLGLAGGAALAVVLVGGFILAMAYIDLPLPPQQATAGESWCPKGRDVRCFPRKPTVPANGEDK